MSDAHVTRPDLDGFVYCPAHGDLLSGVRSWRCANAPKGHEFAALAAERARADQAASEAIHEYARALEQNQSAENWEWPDFVWDAHQWADALADQTSTAEQES